MPFQWIWLWDDVRRIGRGSRPVVCHGFGAMIENASQQTDLVRVVPGWLSRNLCQNARCAMCGHRGLIKAEARRTALWPKPIQEDSQPEAAAR